MLKGIDISNWQAGLQIANLPIDFCIIKATEGNNFVDQYCDGFVQQCIKKKILWGFYHFANNNNAEEEAKYFYDNCLGYIKKGIPVLDYEVWGQNNDVKWCELFLNKFHKLSGVWPMLYISASHCADFNGSWIPEKCGLWVAGYPENYTKFIDSDIPYNISPWEFAAIWQFTSSLNQFNSQIKLNGISVDGNLAFMDKAAWQKYAGAKSNDSTNNKNTNSNTNNNTSNGSHKILTGRVTIELD